MIPNERIVAFSAAGRHGYGVLRETGIVDVSRRLASTLPTLRSVVEAGAWDEVLKAADEADVDHPIGDFTFEPPIPEHARVICVGVNYPDRSEEYHDGSPPPAFPSLFFRFASSFVGHDEPLVRPTVSEQLDYEGEIVLVLGKGGRHIAEADALDHIGAITLCNEGSVRDWMRHAKFNVTQGKNFDRSGAIGPWLIPYRDERQIGDIRLITRVNGEVRQDDRTARMIFGFRYILHYISTFLTLQPGDVIVTGTPTGAGARLDPPVWLRPGDLVEIEADGIGILRNGITSET